MEATIFDIQRFSIHDGPGIRTTVFLKGCNLRCAWCHNPESFKKNSQLSYDNKKCIGCRECAKVCKYNVHSFDENRHSVIFNNCILCGKCIDVCPVNALSSFGKEISTDDVLTEILKDKKYYETSSGGVTISGGEPSLQLDFLLELLKKCKENNINTAVETNGIIPKDTANLLSQYTDLFLLDYKITNKDDYEKYLKHKYVYPLGAFENIPKEKIILRCPIIPSINDNSEHFNAIKKLSENYTIELMPYHDIGKNKWVNIGLDYSLKDIKTVAKEQLDDWKRYVWLS